MMINLLLFYAVFELVRLLTPSRSCINNEKMFQPNDAFEVCVCVCACAWVKRIENFIFENYVMNSNEVKKVCLEYWRMKNKQIRIVEW